MRTIAIFNLKGGVGKTVTAINTAAGLAALGKRVLVVDADSQCNTTEFFGAGDGEHNLASLLQRSRAITDKPQQWIKRMAGGRAWIRLCILPGSDMLMDLDLSAVGMAAVHPARLAELLTLLERELALDYVLIDCPPSFTAASVAALMAAGEVIVPIKLDAFSLSGMTNLLRQVQNMRRINPQLAVQGCLITMYGKDPAILQAERTLAEFPQLPVFRSRIRRSPKVDGMTFAGEPLQIYSPRSAAGQDYNAFVRELMEVEQNGRI